LIWIGVKIVTLHTCLAEKKIEFFLHQNKLLVWSSINQVDLAALKWLVNKVMKSRVDIVTIYMICYACVYIKSIVDLFICDWYYSRHSKWIAHFRGVLSQSSL